MKDGRLKPYEIVAFSAEAAGAKPSFPSGSKIQTVQRPAFYLYAPLPASRSPSSPRDRGTGPSGCCVVEPGMQLRPIRGKIDADIGTAESVGLSVIGNRSAGAPVARLERLPVDEPGPWSSITGCHRSHRRQYPQRSGDEECFNRSSHGHLLRLGEPAKNARLFPPLLGACHAPMTGLFSALLSHVAPKPRPARTAGHCGTERLSRKVQLDPRLRPESTGHHYFARGARWASGTGVQSPPSIDRWATTPS